MNPLMPRSRFFDEFFRDFPLGYSVEPLHGEPMLSPDKIKIDVKNNAKSFTVHAEMPGLNRMASTLLLTATSSQFRPK